MARDKNSKPDNTTVMPKMNQPDQKRHIIRPLSEHPSWSPQPSGTAQKRNPGNSGNAVPSPTGGYGPKIKVERKTPAMPSRPPSGKGKKGLK